MTDSSQTTVPRTVHIHMRGLQDARGQYECHGANAIALAIQRTTVVSSPSPPFF
ncbi:hypothetical protein [Deinococcus apachensis]|uniref:hypothetical protein n=1 Tax=Deinococcus apachensis TaxID=309886 RepID=UPI00036A85B1|nr:hypothetical protein [Deinococcus apachensis]